jgi:hypothetical protein
MRWLVIALLVSLAGLLFAAAAAARHIWLHRAKSRSHSDAAAGPPIGTAPGPPEEIDAETEN